MKTSLATTLAAGSNTAAVLWGFVVIYFGATLVLLLVVWSQADKVKFEAFAIGWYNSSKHPPGDAGAAMSSLLEQRDRVRRNNRQVPPVHSVQIAKTASGGLSRKKGA